MLDKNKPTSPGDEGSAEESSAMLSDFMKHINELAEIDLSEAHPIPEDLGFADSGDEKEKISSQEMLDSFSEPTIRMAPASVKAVAKVDGSEQAPLSQGGFCANSFGAGSQLSEVSHGAEVPVLLAGRYRFDDEIGRGGMGVVYRAFDIRLERIVALKTVRFADKSPEQMDRLVQRFIRECKVVASLNHPNLVTVFDAGESEGILYLVMEFVKGKTLQQIIREKKSMPLDEAASCIAQVCDGLEFAHRAGIVHRDIKPANIMILDNGLAKVMDFGLAHVDDTPHDLTGGFIVGTPDYMPPEQVKNEGIDNRSDVFSLGSVFYLLLTGEKPFSGKKLEEVLAAVLFSEPPPVSSKNKDLDPVVDQVLAKFLAKKKEARFPSAAEAGEAVRNLLALTTFDQTETLEGMSFRRGLVERLPLPLSRLYSRAFNTKDPRDRLHNTMLLADAYITLIAALCVTFYLEKMPRNKKIDARLKTLILPSLGDWLHWMLLIGKYAGLLSETDTQYPARLNQAMLEVRADREGLARGCQTLSKLLGLAQEEATVLTLLKLVVELKSKMRMLEDLPMDQIDPLGVCIFNALSDVLLVVDPLMRTGEILFLGEAVQMSMTEVEIPRLNLRGSTPLRISPLRCPPSEARYASDRLYYFPAGEQEPWSLGPLVTYLEHDLGGDFYFLSGNWRNADIHFLSYNTGHRYLSVALAEEQLALATRVYDREVTADELRELRQEMWETHAERLPEGEEPQGRVTGDFEILEKIGIGGMGTVYKARQLSLNRIVALKMLDHRRVSDEITVARFKREVATLASCDHPNIVKIVDSGFEKGEYYYAMEYIDGITLGELYSHVGEASQLKPLTQQNWDKIREAFVFKGRKTRSDSVYAGRSYYETVALIARDVADALQYTHEMGILHRDVKPSNIMLTPTGHVVLMDFGLAKGMGDNTMTVADHALGTLRYASPQQLQSRKMAIDHRTDIYSLGATLYELTTLSPVFDADSEAEVITKVIYDDPEPLRQLNPRIPADLEVIVNKAMAKRPEDRYADASDFADDLENFVAGKNIKARPPSLVAVLRGTVRRHKEASITAFAALLLLIAGTVLGVLNINAEKIVAQNALALAQDNLTLAYANEGTSYLERKRPLEAAFSFYEALRLSDGWEIRAGLLEAITQTPRLASVLSGPQSEVRILALSADSRILASGGGQGQVVLWDLKRKKKRARIKTEGKKIAAISVSSDNQYLVVAGGTGTIEVIDLKSLEQLFTLEGDGRIASMALSPDSKLLVAGQRDGTIFVWTLQDGKLLKNLTGHGGAVNAIVFSHDGKLIASGSSDTSIKLWDRERFQEVANFEEGASKVQSLAFLPSNETLIAAGSRELRFWDVRSHRSTGNVVLDAPAFSMALSPDGLSIAVTSGREIRLYDSLQRNLKAILNAHSLPVRSVLFASVGDWLFSGSDDGTIKGWDLAERPEQVTLRGHSGIIHSIAVSPDDSLIASGSSDRTIRLWDLETKQQTAVLSGHEDEVFGVTISHDSNLLASGSGDGTIKIWDLRTLQEVQTLRGHQDLVWSVSFGPDDKILASGSEDGTIKLWDLHKRSEIATLTGHNYASVNSVRFMPGGTRLVSGSDDLTIGIWNVKNRLEEGVLSGHTGYVYAVDVTPDRQTLVSAGRDLVGKVWSLPEKRELATLVGHTDLVWTVAVSPDGKLLATGSDDRTVKLWDLSEKRLLATLRGHRAAVSSVSFTSSGRYLVSGSKDLTVKIWDLSFFTEPLDELLSKLKTGYLMPYQGSRFQPLFFAFIATAVNDLLDNEKGVCSRPAVERIARKLRDTGVTPGDLAYLVRRLHGKLTIDTATVARSLYGPEAWKAPPTREFLLAAAEYFLNKMDLKLANRSYNDYFKTYSTQATIAADKIKVALAYLQRNASPGYAEKLARAATQSQPKDSWYKLVYALAMIRRNEFRHPISLLEGIAEDFDLDESRFAAYTYCLGISYYRVGRVDEGIDLMKRSAEMTESEWGRRAAEFLKKQSIDFLQD